MAEFLTPVLLTVAIACVAAVMLSLASKFFGVPVDERQAAIRERLSGANCGACGYAGCDDYAKALANDPTVPSNLCAPGGDAAATKIAAILGQEAMDVIEKVAVIHCSGINDVTKSEMEYQGLQSCAAAKGFFGGPGQCKFGCIGLGDCENACPHGAIQVCEGVAKVDRSICIGCGICAKTCTHGAIVLENNLAYIDFAKCKLCRECEAVCPTGAIHGVNFPKPLDRDAVKARIAERNKKAKEAAANE